jgi:hypothetical protein
MEFLIMSATTNALTSALAPLTQIFAPSAQPNQSAVAATRQPEPVGFLGDPSQGTSPAVMRQIVQRFLQDFEYVRVMDASHGSVIDANAPMDRHPHLQFVMCSDDRKALEAQDPSKNLTSAYLGRQVDRGAYLLKALGLELNEFYTYEDDGILQFDARIPAGKLPQGMSEKQALEGIAAQLQQACTEARANRLQAQQGAARG